MKIWVFLLAAALLAGCGSRGCAGSGPSAELGSSGLSAAMDRSGPIVELDLSGLSLAATSPGLFRDLGRSPLWSVVRDREGPRIARLRSTELVMTGGVGSLPDAVTHPTWLGVWAAAGAPPAEGDGFTVAVTNEGLGREHRGDFRQVTVSVVESLPAEATVVALGAPVTVPIRMSSYASGGGLDGNSASHVAVAVGEQRWLVVREQGASATRAATVEALAVGLSELSRVAGLATDYRARTVYADVFAALGGPAVRYPGMQGRDTLGVVFEVELGRDYDGVHVHVVSDAVCGGECTGEGRQRLNAELLGKPPAGDLAVALIEDCAVYLKPAGSAKHGIFSGTGPFEGTIEWRDASGDVFSSSSGPFRGWER